MSIQYNDSDPSITWNEYLTKVTKKDIPDLFKYIASKPVYSGLDHPQNMLGIQIEKVSPFFVGKLGSRYYWKMKFQYWTTGGTRYLVNLMVEMVGDSLAIRKPTEFSIDNVDSGENTTLEFDDAGNTVGQIITLKENTTPMIQQDRNPGQVFFSVDRWICKCWLLTENWCSHIEDFFARRADDDQVRSICNLQREQGWRGEAMSVRTLKYPMAHGLITVDLTLEGFLEKDIIGQGDGVVHRLMATDDLYIWLETDDSGMKIISQIEEIVKMSPRYDFWHNAAFALRLERGSKCLNSRHNMTDARNFLNACRETGGDRDKLEDLVFVNTYYEVFYGRCKSCYDFIINIGRDVPQL